MSVKRFLLPCALFIFATTTLVHAQNKAHHYPIELIENVSYDPSPITFQNTLEINNNGGHLQGIQYLLYNENDYYVLSGSSEEYSYYSIVKTGKENMVISVNKILEKPYTHAGGFQIYDHLLAIGAEDDTDKNKSKVLIFRLDNPERPPKAPLAVIERMGTFKRATAGCVGITIVSDKVLVVVGDWDTEHLDFYRIDHQKLGLAGEALELEYSINIKNLDKSEWTDTRWLAYQNINLIKDPNDNLYLAGMTSDQDKDVLDLFELQATSLSSFDLKKIYSRNFGRHDSTKFKWGAGTSYSHKGRMEVISCGENIREKSIIHIYK